MSESVSGFRRLARQDQRLLEVAFGLGDVADPPRQIPQPVQDARLAIAAAERPEHPERQLLAFECGGNVTQAVVDARALEHRLRGERRVSRRRSRRRRLFVQRPRLLKRLRIAAPCRITTALVDLARGRDGPGAIVGGRQVERQRDAPQRRAR